MYSGRTLKYVEALIREGDKFNHGQWLKRVRQEEGELELAHQPPQVAGAAVERNLAKPQAKLPAIASGPPTSYRAKGVQGRRSAYLAAQNVRSSDPAVKSVN